MVDIGVQFSFKIKGEAKSSCSEGAGMLHRIRAGQGVASVATGEQGRASDRNQDQLRA